MAISLLSNLIVSLENSSEIVKNLIDGIPVDELGVKRRPSFWSIQHHVFHLADTQRLFHQRLLQFKREKKPVFTPFFPDKNATNKPVYTSASDAIAAFQDWRRKVVDIIKTMDEADLMKEGVHPEYKKYNPLIVIRHFLMHDYWHMYRIEELWLTNDEFLSEG